MGNWKLKRLSCFGGLLKILPVWFKHSKTLRACYSKTVKWDRTVFQPLEKKSRKAQVYLANGLHAIRLSYYSLLLQAFGHKWERLNLSKLHWIINCPPVGHWEGLGPKSLFCRNLLCPWCWLRRHDLLYRCVLSPAGERILCHGRKIAGLGLGARLHCLSFRAHGAGFFDSPAHYNELLRLVSLETVKLRQERPLLRFTYPMPDLEGAAVAFLSDRPFGASTGTEPFHSLPGGALGTHVTARPLHVSQLLATRALWVPEMLSDAVKAEKACEVFRGKNLFNVIGSKAE